MDKLRKTSKPTIKCNCESQNLHYKTLGSDENLNLDYITQGSHPWNINNRIPEEKQKECPHCSSDNVVDDRCLTCGYHPDIEDASNQSK